jgi:hypothetical protein
MQGDGGGVSKQATASTVMHIRSSKEMTENYDWFKKVSLQEKLPT